MKNDYEEEEEEEKEPTVIVDEIYLITIQSQVTSLRTALEEIINGEGIDSLEDAQERAREAIKEIK
jgi:hypothetical protein